MYYVMVAFSDSADGVCIAGHDVTHSLTSPYSVNAFIKPYRYFSTYINSLDVTTFNSPGVSEPHFCLRCIDQSAKDIVQDCMIKGLE